MDNEGFNNNDWFAHHTYDVFDAVYGKSDYIYANYGGRAQHKGIQSAF